MLEQYVTNVTKVVDRDTAVMSSTRTDYGTKYGPLVYEQIRVIYKGRTRVQEWLSRAKLSPEIDRPDLAVYGFGKVEIKEEGGTTTIVVELVNTLHGNGRCTFTLSNDDNDEPEIPLIEQQMLLLATRSERDRIFYEIREAHRHVGGDVRYKPKVCQTLFRPDVGVMAFVVENESKHALYVVTHDNQTARQIAEDSHLVILDVTARIVTFMIGRDARSVLV